MMKIADLLIRAVQEAPSADWNSMLIEVSREIFDAVADETGAEIKRRRGWPLGYLMRIQSVNGLTFEVCDIPTLSADEAVVASQNVDVWSGRLLESAHERLVFRMHVEQKAGQNVEQSTTD